MPNPGMVPPSMRPNAMPPGFHRLIAAQAVSALADNALLIVAIALLQEQGRAAWWAPLLKFAFTLSYVFLAPVVGPLADAFPKARLMSAMNAVKTLGLLLLLGGVHPVLAFAVVGFGAAAYAPAKYGLVTELVPPERLVAANGWIEVSVVCAVLLGTVTGGLLVSDFVRHGDAAAWLSDALAGAGLAPSTLRLSLLVVLASYLASAVLGLHVPDSGARYPSCRLHVADLTRDFLRGNRMLWRDPEGGLSLAATTIFWGVGATLQFAVLRWAIDAMGLTLDRAAYLQAVVAVGVVAGAAIAGRHVPLAHAKRALPAGVLLGLLIAVAAATPSIAVAWPLLALVGAVGGLLVVPLNALLQHRGLQVLSAGRSIAVQGCNEHLGILAMLSIYAALVAADVPIVPLMAGLGIAVALAIGLLVLRERVRRARRLAAAGE